MTFFNTNVFVCSATKWKSRRRDCEHKVDENNLGEGGGNKTVWWEVKEGESDVKGM